MTTPRFIQIPKLPQRFDERSVRSVLEAMRHNMQQLISAGISPQVFRNIYFTSITSADIPAPDPEVEPEPDLTPPARPLGLVGTVGAYDVTLRWDPPPVGDTVSYYEVWRYTGLTNDVDRQAELIGSTFVRSYTDIPPQTGKNYYYWVRAVSAATVPSLFSEPAGPFQTSTQAPDPDTDPPGSPTQLEAVGGIRLIFLTWNPPSDPDVAYYEVFRHTADIPVPADVPSTATWVGDVMSSLFSDYIDAGDFTEYFYFVRAVDRSGNIGPFDVSPIDRSAQAATLDIVDYADTIRPVLIWSGAQLPALPDDEYPDGQIIFWTVDRQLYRNDNGTWVRVVRADDLFGQIVADQIADGVLTADKFATSIEPVEVVDALPNPVGYTGVSVVFLTTDKKLYRYDASVPEWTTAVPTGDLIGTIDGTQIAVNSITAGQIQAGAIGTDELAARSVTAEKLVITSLNNLLNNPRFIHDDGSTSYELGWSFDSQYAVVDSGTDGVTARVGTKMVKGTRDGTFTGIVNDYEVPVSPGETYYARVWAQRSASWTDDAGANIRLQLNIYDKDMALLGQANLSTATSSEVVAGNWVRLSGQYTVPDTVSGQVPAFVRFRAMTRGEVTAGTIYFCDPWLSRAGDGELIVDGAITAAKIAAGTITANEIAANTITADEIAANTITAGQIAAGAISADEIAANAVQADKMAANSITAANAALANAVVTEAKIADLAVTNAKINDLAASKITAGTISAFITMAERFALTTNGRLYTAGKTSFSSNIAGVYLGWDATEAAYVFNIGNADNYVKWDGSGLTVVGYIDFNPYTNDEPTYQVLLFDNATTAVERTADGAASYYAKEAVLERTGRVRFSVEVKRENNGTALISPSVRLWSARLSAFVDSGAVLITETDYTWRNLPLNSDIQLNEVLEIRIYGGELTGGGNIMGYLRGVRIYADNGTGVRKE